jgi:hypothetical protein
VWNPVRRRSERDCGMQPNIAAAPTSLKSPMGCASGLRRTKTYRRGEGLSAEGRVCRTAP